MSMNEVIEKNASSFARAGYIIVFFGMLTQVGHMHGFPSYNIPLGFWAVYSAYSKNGKAVFAFITFATFSILLDIIYCSMNVYDSHGFRFALAMLIFCLFAKIYGLYTSSHFFASIGGSRSLQDGDGMQSSTYEALAGSIDGALGGGYYPPSANGPAASSTAGRKPNVTTMADSGAF